MIEDEEYRKAALQYQKYYRKRAIRACFNKVNIDMELKELHTGLRIFYWLKTLICLLLNRTHGLYLMNSIYALGYDSYRDYWGEYSWRGCWVERGVFKNWQVCLASDGS